jgi:hypothetical protein
MPCQVSAVAPESVSHIEYKKSNRAALTNYNCVHIKRRALSLSDDVALLARCEDVCAVRNSPAVKRAAI